MGIPRLEKQTVGKQDRELPKDMQCVLGEHDTAFVVHCSLRLLVVCLLPLFGLSLVCESLR